MNPNLATLPVCPCPTCGYKMDSATCAEDENRKARPGDLSVCMKCGLPENTQDELVRVQRIVREKRVLG